MSGFENSVRFWKEQAAAEQDTDPETKLLRELGARRRLMLTDVPKILSMTSDEALHVVESLRARDKVAVIETDDSAKYLRLK